MQRRNAFFLVLVLLCIIPLRSVTADMHRTDEELLLQETMALSKEIKEFGKTLGIEPTEALTKSTIEKPAQSVLWIWLQKHGTLATRSSTDIYIQLKFDAPKEQMLLNAIGPVNGFSIFVRQGNQFGHKDAVITTDFAKEPKKRIIEVVFHEDLHDQKNFTLPWELEESLVSPLAMLAARQFFESKNDWQNAEATQGAIEFNRKISQELNTLVAEAERLFQTKTLGQAREEILNSLRLYRAYYDHRWSGVSNEEAERRLEAAISHDFAYWRHFDRVVSLYEQTSDLRLLIADLKKAPADYVAFEKYLDELAQKKRPTATP